MPSGPAHDAARTVMRPLIERHVTRQSSPVGVSHSHLPLTDFIETLGRTPSGNATFTRPETDSARTSAALVRPTSTLPLTVVACTAPPARPTWTVPDTDVAVSAPPTSAIVIFPFAALTWASPVTVPTSTRPETVRASRDAHVSISSDPLRVVIR